MDSETNTGLFRIHTCSLAPSMKHCIHDRYDYRLFDSLALLLRYHKQLQENQGGRHK